MIRVLLFLKYMDRKHLITRAFALIYFDQILISAK